MNFTREPLDEVLVDDAIRGCEKGENVRNKVALICVEPVLPIVEILGEIHLLSGPERRLRLFVHLPNLLNLLVTWLPIPRKALKRPEWYVLRCIELGKGQSDA